MMSYHGPIQWYHFQADLIRSDDNFNSVFFITFLKIFPNDCAPKPYPHPGSVAVGTLDPAISSSRQYIASTKYKVSVICPPPTPPRPKKSVDASLHTIEHPSSSPLPTYRANPLPPPPTTLVASAT